MSQISSEQLYLLESKPHNLALDCSVKESCLPGQNANSVQSGVMSFGSSGFLPSAVPLSPQSSIVHRVHHKYFLQRTLYIIAFIVFWS